MNSLSRFGDLPRWYAALAVLAMLAACTTGPKVVDHAFTFDVLTDSPDAELLAYRYGESNLPVSWTPGPTVKAKAPQRSSVNGPMLQGDSLYVKWRLKSTGAVYEDTVDLRYRLPKDITNHRIYFMIKGPQLFIFLIPPLQRPGGSNTPSMYPDANTARIYPDPPKM